MKRTHWMWVVGGGIVLAGMWGVGERARARDQQRFDTLFAVPENNVHAELLETASQIMWPTGMAIAADDVALTTVVSAHQAVIDGLLALSREPARLSPPPPGTVSLPELRVMKQALILMEARVELAKREGRIESVLQRSWERMRVARALTRGGLLIHGQFLASAETQSLELALEWLDRREQAFRPDLRADMKSELEGFRDPLVGFVERERAWMRRYAPPLARIVNARGFEQSLKRVTNTFAVNEALFSQVVGALEAAATESENTHPTAERAP